MKAVIKPSDLSGTVVAPPSKSMSHRLMICGGLSSGNSVVHGIAPSEDMLATLDCLRALGAECVYVGDTVSIRGLSADCLKNRMTYMQNRDKIDSKEEKQSGNYSQNGGAFVQNSQSDLQTVRLKCRESGSTLRFFIPICAALGIRAELFGSETLLKRPLEVYETLFRERGLRFENDGKRVRIEGKLRGGTFCVRGDCSSQFISGLLFALPLLEADSRIRMIPPVESRPYINLTVGALEQFGVSVVWEDENTLFVRGGQRYRSGEVFVEGDYSNAAFFEALRYLGQDVTVTGLDERSMQGDRVYRDYFPLLESGTPTLDLHDCPDLAPVLFALAAAKHGAVFTGTRRLKMKESDRAHTMAEELRKMGARVLVEEDTVTVRCAALHAPNEILCGHNDHRIVMALAVLLTKTGGTIEGAQAVAKSMPDFFERIRAIGAEAELYD